jgi:tetratricopeptide (TPR) repeat protein
LALHLAGRHDFKRAVATLEEGSRAIPSDPRLRLKLAEILQLAGDPERAILEYEIVLKDRPDHDLAANNLASLLLDKRTDKASFSRALDLAKRFENSRNPAYADTLGWAHYRQQNYDLALLHLRRAAGAVPDAAVIQYHIGVALLGKGDKTGALAHLKRAVDSPQKFPDKDHARKSLELAHG